jgi:hypothetical protein
LKFGNTEYHYINVKVHLNQQIKQLRSYCIMQKKDQMVGVITNSKDWIFTRYDMKAELNNIKGKLEVR